MSKSINEIELSSSTKNRLLYMAIFMGVASFIIFILFNRIAGMPIGIAVLFIFIWFFNQNVMAFKFLEKHFVFQIAVLGKKNVSYSGLKSYSIVGKNIIIIYQNPNEKEKTLKFPIKTIEPSQLSFLEKTIKNKINS